ncbi:MAG: phosphopantothenoylcysteine decarboxylase [Rickettsiales bacterium]
MSFRVLVTAGPTHEALDPVRYLGNRSSGKQGAAVANGFADKGCDVTLVLGPVERAVRDLLNPRIQIVDVRSAQDMLCAALAFPSPDVVAMAAAVADWRPAVIFEKKMKKQLGQERLSVEFLRNPDILKMLAASDQRPRLLIGFAAETAEDDAELLSLARAKLRDKKCDWIVANNVSGGATFGADANRLLLAANAGGVMRLGEASKMRLGLALAEAATKHLNGEPISWEDA